MLITRGKKKKSFRDPEAERGRFDPLVMAYSTALFTGYVPVAPGTAGSAAGLLLWWFWAGLDTRPFSTLLFFLVIFFTGIAVTTRAKKITHDADHHLIVVDEMLGCMIAASFVWKPGYYVDGTNLVLAFFIVYRIINILKPFPLGKLEELPDGWGIMCDDLVAGVITGLIFYLPLESHWESILELTKMAVHR